MSAISSAVKKTDKEIKRGKAALATAVGIAATFAVVTAGIACLTAYYCKSLTKVNYLGDDDIYEE